MIWAAGCAAVSFTANELSPIPYDVAAITKKRFGHVDEST